MSFTLPCFLFPLRTHHILLPSAAVAEVLRDQKPKEALEGPGWLLGLLSWRGIDVPLTRLENMSDPPERHASEDSTLYAEDAKHCIVVLNRATEIPKRTGENAFDVYPFFAIVADGIPILKHLSEEAIEIITPFSEKEKRFLMQVRISHETACIPNMINLWKMIDALVDR